MWATCPMFRQHTVPPMGMLTVCGLKKLSPITTSVEPLGQVGGGGGGGGGGGPPEVVMFSAQLVIEPMSAAASSTRYRFQVPFADRPSKTDRLTFPEGTGAGAREDVGRRLVVRRSPGAGRDLCCVGQLGRGLVVEDDVDGRDVQRAAGVRPDLGVLAAGADEQDVDVIGPGVRGPVDRHVQVGDRPAWSRRRRRSTDRGSRSPSRGS